MHRLAVGERYRDVPGPLAPHTQYSFQDGQHELLLILDKLKPEEIEAIRKGPCEFGVLTYRRLIFFLYRFEGGPAWSDCPCNIWRVPEARRGDLEPLTPESRVLLQVVLVDAGRNRVEVLRGVSLPPRLTQALYRAIANQLTAKISIGEQEEIMAAAYQLWPNTKQMVARAITGKGGE